MLGAAISNILSLLSLKLILLSITMTDTQMRIVRERMFNYSCLSEKKDDVSMAKHNATIRIKKRYQVTSN